MAEDAWKNFELSGKVSDYLTYRQSTGVAQGSQEGKPAGRERGMGSYGAERDSIGHGVECDADGRI